MSLSDKIFDSELFEGQVGKIFTKDVKEFIKELNSFKIMKVKKASGDYMDGLNDGLLLFKEELKRQAGDDLI